jgi:hypothetical protein
MGVKPDIIASFLSAIPLELPAAPMMVFPIRIKHARDIPVQCPHDANPRKHRRSARRRHQDQRLHRGLHSSASCSAFVSFVM